MQRCRLSAVIMSQNSRLSLMNDACSLKLLCSTQYHTCQFRMVLWNEQLEWLKISSVSWSKRLNCQLSSEFKQQRSMSIFAIVQLLNLSLMINQLLQRKHSLNWSHSSIIFTCESANAMSMLISDHYLLKIDRTSLWIVKKWECSWNTSMKSWSSTGCGPQISSTSSEVMLSSLLRMKREKM